MPLLEALSGFITRTLGSRYLGNLNREMHAMGAFPGHSWRAHVEALERFVPDLKNKRILDYGCGPLGGLRQEFGDSVIAYDPFVEAYSSPPWGLSFDVVFSSDVLEHMLLTDIDDLLRQIVASPAKYVFLNVSTRPAHKPLPNRANPHLTVRSASWWLEHLSRSFGGTFTATLAESDLLRDEGTFCFQRTNGLPNGQPKV